MLRYIHQFVQTFLKEASKSRPKSRKSSRSSIDLLKDKSAVKPEILAIANNEGPETERSKEILELKRTYSLLMKKFVNPKLDLMTNTKSSIDINISSLKEKHELIRSLLNKIFYDTTHQQKPLEDSSKDLFEVTHEESSVGWSGQRTSKLAANPMVETSSKSNNLASAFSMFPETLVEPPKKNLRQTDKFLKHRLKPINLRAQNVETNQHISAKSKNVVESDLRTSESSREIEPENISVSGTTNENVIITEGAKESVMENEDKMCSGNAQMSFLPKFISKGNLQPSLNMKLNNHSEINEKSSNSSSERKDLTQYNQKKNINIIRSIVKVDKSKTAKTETHPINKKSNDNTKIVKNTNPDKNKVSQKRTNKQQKAVTNVKNSVDQQNLGTVVSKKKESLNDKKYKGKSEQLTCSPMNPEELVSDSLPNDFKPSPSDAETSDKAYEKVELSTLKNDAHEETSNEVATVKGENLSKQNFETLEKEHQISFEKTEIKECDALEQPQSHNIDQAEKHDEKSINEAVNEKPKSSEDSVWNLISDKLLKTSNDAQKFISNLEINNWKTKTISTTQALAKDLIGINISDKQDSVELPNESSKQDNRKTPNSTDVKVKTCDKLDKKGTDSEKTKTLQNTVFKAHISEDKPLTTSEEEQHSSKKPLLTSKNVNLSESQVKGNQLTKSRSEDFNPVTKTSVHNFKQNNMITKSSNDLSNNITNIHESNERQTNSNISLRKTNNNMAGNKETDLKSGSISKAKIVKVKITDSMLSENHKNPETELHPKEINSIVNVKNTMPEGDSKINNLLRRFKKIHKSKSKHNVGNIKRIYSKILNEGKLKKISLDKFQENKEKILAHKIRRAMRTKSDELAIDKTLSSDVPVKAEPHLSPVVVSNTITLGKKKSKIINNKNKVSVTPTKVLNEPTKRVKVNKVDSNIFPNVDIINHERMTDIDECNTSNFALKGTDRNNKRHSTTKITTEFDLTKSRKLHSRKEFCKPTKLQMYGARRSIYTQSIPKAISSKNILKSCISENMTSGSLIYVCGLTANKQRNLHSITTQVRNLHTRGRVKQLPRKKRATVIKVIAKTKSVNVNSTDETTGNTSKEIEMKSDPPQPTVKIPHRSCSNNSPNSEPMVKVEESKRETQSKPTEKNNNCTLGGSSRSSLLSSVKTKVDDTTKVLFSRSERNSGLIPISDSKEDTLTSLNSNATSKQTDGMDVKSSELGLNLDLQNSQSSQGNGAILDSPKWKSRSDRLENWKLEAESNCAEENIEDVVKKANEVLENNSSNAQTVGINIHNNSIVLEKDEEKKELPVDHLGKTDTAKNLKLSNDNMGKNNLQKDDKDSMVCGDVEKKVQGKRESKKLCKDTVKVLSPNINENSSIQNKTKNNSLITIKNESTNEVDENKKKETSNTKKMKEFETKLRVLEYKLRALEMKSVEENNTESSLKTNVKKDTYCITPSHSNNIKIDENKTGSKEEKKISQPIGIKSMSKNKNIITNLTFSVKNDNKSIKKDQNDPIKEHLSLKVKNLEHKLESLETKLKDLKGKPTDSANNNKDLSKMSSLSRSLGKESKTPNLTKPEPILNISKLDEELNNLHTVNHDQIGSLNISNKRNMKEQSRDKCGTSKVMYTKPEIYLKNYLNANKNNFGDQIQSKINKTIYNNTRYSGNINYLLPPQGTSIMNELKLTNNHSKNVNNLSEKILKPKSKPKHIKSSEISEANKIVSHITNKTYEQQIKNSGEKSVGAPIQKVLHDKGTSIRKLNRGNNMAQTTVSQNIFSQKVHLASTLDKSNVVNLKNHKVRSMSSISSASIPIPVIQKGSSKSASKSKNSPLNNSNNDVADQKNVTNYTRKTKRKFTPFNASKRLFLKGNSNQRLKKGRNNFDSQTHLREKQNTLHEGLIISSRKLNSVSSNKGTTLMNVIDKISSSSRTNLPTIAKSIKPPVLPKKLSKALNNLKSPRKKQDLNDSKREVRSDLDSTGSWKSVKDQNDSTSGGSSRRKVENKAFNSFNFYRPKRRSHEIKHPIEKENKYGIMFLRKNENSLDKFYPKGFTQNSTTFCDIQL